MISTTLLIVAQSSHILLYGLCVTMMVALCAIVIGLAGGLLCGLLTSKKLQSKWLANPIGLYVLIVRGTPVYVQVLLMYYALPDLLGINLSPFAAGVIALGCNSIAYVAEIIRGGMNSINQGQWEACYVLGYSTNQALKAIILPQVIKIVLPSLTNELVVLLKETSILSVIGLLEITRVGMNLSAHTLDPLTVYLVIALLYLVMTTGISFAAKKIEKGFEYDKGQESYIEN